MAPFDESGMRINGTLNGFHVAATGTVVHYTAHPKRGREAMDAAGILPGFRGIAVHDHWKPYRVYTHCSHALCNAHHLRELNYGEALTGHGWPVELRRVLLDGKDAVAAAKAARKAAVEPAQLADLSDRDDRQVAIGLAGAPARAGREKRSDQAARGDQPAAPSARLQGPSLTVPHRLARPVRQPPRRAPGAPPRSS